jgi:hypothetical protein
LRRTKGGGLALRTIAVVWALNVAACADQPPPKSAADQRAPIMVEFTGDGLSTFSDMPMGTYHVPKSEVLVSGFEKGSALGVALGSVGGLAGIAMASSAYGAATDTSEGRKAVQTDEPALQIALQPLAEQHLRTLLESDTFAKKFTLAPAHGGTILRVGGNVVLQFFDDGGVRPFVVLRANLISPPGRSIWTTRYSATLGDPRPIAGDVSWTSDQGKSLDAIVSAELQRALQVMLTDISSPFLRDSNEKVTAEGYFPFIKKRVQIVGVRLAEDPLWFAFAAKVPATSLLSGVNIMDKSSARYRAAMPGDPRMKAITPP